MHQQKERGFTLIEMMVTVVIVAILAAVAVPSYKDYVMRGKITQATNNLAAMRVKIEQFYQDNRTYEKACETSTNVIPTKDDFEYSCPTLKPNEFTAQAKGLGTMVDFTYTINQDNERQTTGLPTGWGTAPGGCWVTKKGGAC